MLVNCPEVNTLKMTPRLDMLNRMPGVRIQPVGGAVSVGPVVAKKSAPPPAPSYHEFYDGREDFDTYQGVSSGAKKMHKNDSSKGEKIFATAEQKKVLMDNYLINNYPSMEDVCRMTEVTGLDERFLKQWFQYTRKFMKSKGKIPVRIELPENPYNCGSSKTDKEFVSFQYDPRDAVDTKIDKNSFTHDEAIEKAMKYDSLKKKFDELHKNFMNMSNALLKKGFRGDDDPHPASPPPQITPPPQFQEPSETAKEEPPENGDKTLNGSFRPTVDSTSTPLVARVKQEKDEDSDKQTKKEPLDNEDIKDDPSKNINLPVFPQDPSPYPPQYHPGPYPPHPMYPPYQNPNVYNPNYPPHMQPPPNWPPYQQPSWTPGYPPYGSPGYPPNFPQPSTTKFNPAPGYPPAPPQNGANIYPGQTPPPSHPFHSTPPPPQLSGQTPPPPFHQSQPPPYHPHQYHPQPPHYQDQYQNSYSHPQDPNAVIENMQMKTEDQTQVKAEITKIKTEDVPPPGAVDSDITA